MDPGVANLLCLQVREVEEAERSGAAAQRLLAVTCDASTRLSDDLRTGCFRF